MAIRSRPCLHALATAVSLRAVVRIMETLSHLGQLHKGLAQPCDGPPTEEKNATSRANRFDLCKVGLEKETQTLVVELNECTSMLEAQAAAPPKTATVSRVFFLHNFEAPC